MIPDIHIRDDVQRELYYTRQLDAARIGVSVEDGVVTLTGIVDNYDQKSAAIHAAERVAGTRAVACALAVLPGVFFTPAGCAQGCDQGKGGVAPRLRVALLAPVTPT